MKRNRIGNTDIDLTLPYWSGGKDNRYLRRSEVYLYALIDLLQEESNLLVKDEEIQVKYNEMDIYFAVLKAIEAFGTKPDLLQRAGVVLGQMIDKGDFANTYDSLETRNNEVNDLIVAMQEKTNSFTGGEMPAEWNEWWLTSVTDKNFYADPVTGTTSIYPPNATGIGAASNYDTYSKEVKESGMYWLYAISNNHQWTTKATAKRIKHIGYINWFDSCNTGLSRASIEVNARAGVIAKTLQTPEECLNKLQTEGAKRIGGGWTAALIIKLIVACIGVIAALGTAIAQIISATKGKDAPTKAQLQANAGTIDDWYGFYGVDDEPGSGAGGTISDTITEAFSSPWVWVGVAVLAFGLLS